MAAVLQLLAGEGVAAGEVGDLGARSIAHWLVLHKLCGFEGDPLHPRVTTQNEASGGDGLSKHHKESAASEWRSVFCSS